MMISSPLMTPRVSTAARSEPWFGSEKPWQYTSSPEMILGRKCARCSGVACTMIDGPTRLSPMPLLTRGTPARWNSSLSTAMRTASRPWPPNSSGHCGQISRLACSLAVHSW